MRQVTLMWLKKVLENAPTTWLKLNEKAEIISAVEKEISQPLKFTRKLSSCYSVYICPRCRKTRYITNNIGDYPKRCSNCGQKLDWKQFKKEEKEC